MPSLSNWLFYLPRLAREALRPLALLAVLAVGVAAGTYWVLLVRADHDLLAVRSAYEVERQRQVTLRRDREVQEHARELKKELGTIWKMLPPEKDFAALAIEIAELAGKVRVSIPGMNYTQKQVEEGLPDEGSLSFRATGRYRDIYRFIHQLETMDTYLVIERLDASQASAGRGKGAHAVQFNIDVVTFLKSDPAPPETT